MPPPSSNDIEITNYDVLADQISNPIGSDEGNTGLSLAAHSYHVGNNRLEVLCNIHNQAFSDHQAKGDETSSAAIVDKIMTIVQNQCVPKGRFLERSNKGVWSVVAASKARSLVRQALMKTQGSSSVETTAAPGASEEDVKKKEQDDAEKKRRRRSSLLRRSVSSSMLPNLMKAGREFELTSFDDKKKASRQGSILRPGELSSTNSPVPTPKQSPVNSPKNSPPNSRSSSPIPRSSGHRRASRGKSDAEKKLLPEQSKPRPAFGRSHSVELGQGRSTRRFATKYTGPEIVKETLKMDVLLNTAKTALLPGADLHGNNRLRVMVNIQTMTYQNAKEESEKDKMAEDLLNTIENFWGGRVLSIIPSMRRKGGDDEQYIKLESIHACQAMKNLLSGKAAEKEEAVTQGATPDPKIPQGRRASLKAIESIAAVGVGVGAGDSKTIMPSTLPTLPPDMQHLRSAAVKSLQKRKVRQGLNSRIRGYTADKAAIYQDGSTNASVLSSSNGAPMPSQIISRASSTASSIQNIPQYRQSSSGASVASSVGGTSTGPPGMVQRQGSVCSTTSTVATSMTMNAARNMANINLNASPSPLLSSTVVNLNGMVGGPMLGSELHIPNSNVPNNIMAPMLQQQTPQAHLARMSQMSQQMQQSAQQIQQQQSSQAHLARMSQMSQQMQQSAQQIQQQQSSQAQLARMSQVSQQMQQSAQQIQQQQMMQQMQMQQQQQMQQQMQMQQQVNQHQFQPRQVTMPSVPEEQFNSNGNYSDPTPLSFEQLQQLAQLGNQQQEPQFDQQSFQNNGGMGSFQGQQQQQEQHLHQQQHQVQGDSVIGNGRQDRNSLLNSTGSDGLPKFGENEMEMLIKGLEE